MPSNPYGQEPSLPEDYARFNFEVIKKRWDSKAANWEEDLKSPDCHLNEDNAYEHFLEIADIVIKHHIPFCSTHGIIDIGCGTGLVLSRLVELFLWGIGIDISSKMLEIAKNKNLPHTEFLLGNCFDLIGEMPRPGVVVSRGVLLSHYGMSLAYDLLKKIWKALASNGGFALLDFLNAEAASLYPTMPTNKTLFTADQILSIGEQCGFRHVEILGERNLRRNLIVLMEC